MYKSPIELFITDMQNQIEKQKDDHIYTAVVSCGINVDKEELLRALKYDRAQYSKGYADGKAAATVFGQWLINPDGYFPYCSNCNTEPKNGEMTDYCPKCGSNMRGHKNQ